MFLLSPQKKDLLFTIYELFNKEGKSEIFLRPPEIREKIDEDIWEDKSLNNHQKDIKIGQIIRKFNISTEKKRTNKGVAYLFQKEKVEKIKNLYCKEPDNTSHFSLLVKSHEILTENTEKNSEKLINLDTSL